jgi:hypothetical protein
VIAEAATPWSDAAIMIAGILLLLTITVAVIASITSTLRARMSVQREDAYRKLADDAVAAQHRTADQLERAVAELTELRTRTGELERVLKEVG